VYNPIAKNPAAGEGGSEDAACSGEDAKVGEGVDCGDGGGGEGKGFGGFSLVVGGHGFGAI
jgi:hypothetical protein